MTRIKARTHVQISPKDVKWLEILQQTRDESWRTLGFPRVGIKKPKIWENMIRIIKERRIRTSKTPSQRKGKSWNAMNENLKSIEKSSQAKYREIYKRWIRNVHQRSYWWWVEKKFEQVTKRLLRMTGERTDQIRHSGNLGLSDRYETLSRQNKSADEAKWKIGISFIDGDPTRDVCGQRRGLHLPNMPGCGRFTSENAMSYILWSMSEYLATAIANVSVWQEWRK